MKLSDRVEALDRASNDVDVLVEVALFLPSKGWESCRPNNAGTKVVYTRSDGVEETFRAADHTHTASDRKATVAALRARGL